MITPHIASASPQAVQSAATRTAATIVGLAAQGKEAAQHGQRREGITNASWRQATTTIPVAELERFCRAVLAECGMNEADARVTTDVLVTTDTFGVFTHGIEERCRATCGGCAAAGSRPTPSRRSDAEGPAWAIVDGQSAIGMVTSVFAMKTAIEKAKTTGMAYVGVQNSCHFGAAGYYAAAGCQGRHVRHGDGQRHSQHGRARPRKAVLGTNPFAYAVPAASRTRSFWTSPQVPWPAARSACSRASINRCPTTWLVDTEGVPTTDPFAYPFPGSLLPFAGHKGYGIALMIETLAGVLSGAGMRGQILQLDRQRSRAADAPRGRVPGHRRRANHARRRVSRARGRDDLRHPPNADGQGGGADLPARRNGVGEAPRRPWPAAFPCPPTFGPASARWARKSA